MLGCWLVVVSSSSLDVHLYRYQPVTAILPSGAERWQASRCPSHVRQRGLWAGPGTRLPQVSLHPERSLCLVGGMDGLGAAYGEGTAHLRWGTGEGEWVGTSYWSVRRGFQ